MKITENTNPQGSEHKGPRGWYERLLRKHQRLVLSLTLGVAYLFVATLLGLSASPGFAWAQLLFNYSEGLPYLVGLFIKGFALFSGYFIFGFTAILLIPLPNKLVIRFLKPFRGAYFSTSVFPWYVHNILTYSVRYSFLDWITPTPFNIFFYQAMGMRVGLRSEINTSNISDPGMIRIEDEVTVGGSATLLAHYAVRGYLVIAPVIIRRGATIGLKATIMGGAEIGEGAKVLPNSLILPKTKVPAGETWAGVPAKKVDLDHQG